MTTRMQPAVVYIETDTNNVTGNMLSLPETYLTDSIILTHKN